MPIPTIEFIVGSIAESKALSTISLEATLGVAPNMRAVSINPLLEFISLTNLTTPSDTPVIELPIIIPVIGIMYLGSYQGETLITKTEKKTRGIRVPTTIEKAIILFKFLDSSKFTCLNILYIAKHSIKIIIPIVYM